MPTLTNFYTLKEAAKHNTKEDCWCVINGKAYDVTSYLDDHPGGDDVILEVTGKDATDEFEDAGHSQEARDMLKDYFIGEIDESSIPAKNESIPELEIFSKNESATKFTNLVKQYWVVPVAIASISIVAGIIYLRRR